MTVSPMSSREGSRVSHRRHLDAAPSSTGPFKSACRRPAHPQIVVSPNRIGTWPDSPSIRPHNAEMNAGRWLPAFASRHQRYPKGGL
jgi:hypothetical protein